MFWKFNLLTSHTDSLLDKEDVTLQELLEEDDVLQECKAQNRRLIKFLIRPDNIEELVNLVTQEPPEDAEEKNRYRNSNTACELLTSDVTDINDKLASEDALLNKIYGFLEAEGPLNPLLASFFSKVMGLLITRKSEMMLDFLKAKDDFVGQLLHHLGTSAIMDLLLRLITCIESQEIRNAAIGWLNEQHIVQKLVGMIDPSEPEEKHCNASQSLCDIIRLSREQMAQLQEKAEHDPLLTTIESQETVADLLNHMFSTEKNESVIVNGLAVIQTLLEYRKTSLFYGDLLSDRPDGSEQMTALDAERLAQGVSNTLMALTPRLKDVHQLLLEPPKQHFSLMPTTIGPLDPPLGNTRLQVARLVSSILLTNTHSINVELANLGTMNTILDLYFKYSWNNFLHTQVDQCITTILNNGPPESDDKEKAADETPLLTHLFMECKLVQRILDAWEDNEQQQSRPGGHRKGFMGHLTKIANSVVSSLEKGITTDRIKELFNDLPEDYRERWDTFMTGSLAEMNKQNTVELVGGQPLHSSSEDDDPDFRDIPFPQDTAMQQAFSDYQLQQMTSNFIDQFGFNEEEFAEQEERVGAPFNERISSINFDMNSSEDNPNAASLFEQACNERMQQFDDADSDEDLWEEKEITFSQGADTRQGGTMQSTGPRARTTGSDDSDGSTDSEEELDSPKRIYQTPPTSNTEKMDVDSTENWPRNLDEVPMDAAPVAMDTASPWDSQPASSTTSQGDNWANFGDMDKSSSQEPSSNTEDNWANFSSISSLQVTQSRTEPGPRANSPVAMDTAESRSNRPAAYLVHSAPADLATEVTKVEAADSTSDEEVSKDKTRDTQSNEAEESTRSAHRLDTVSRPGPLDSSAKEEVPTSTTTDTLDNEADSVPPPLPTTEPPSLDDEEPPSPPSSAPPRLSQSESSKGITDDASTELKPPTTTATSDNSQSLSDLNKKDDPAPDTASSSNQQEFDDFDDDEDDLSANFNFLAAGGLMKSMGGRGPSRPSPPEPEPQGNGPTEAAQEETKSDTASAPALSEQARLEEARAKAKEALENYLAATTAGNTLQNGPV